MVTDFKNMIFGPGDDNYGRNKKQIDMETKQETTEMDKCVSCGKETPYSKYTHIDERYYYVEGAGQLCKECFLLV